jgi:hypothetical protein
MDQAAVMASREDQETKKQLDQARKTTKRKNRFRQMRRSAQRAGLRGSLMSQKKKKHLIKDIQRFQNAPWILAFTVAISKDMTDLVPILNITLIVIFGIYLIYFTWKAGAKKDKLFYSAFLVGDLVPILGIIPISSCLIIFLHYRTKRRADRATSKLKRMYP